MGLLNSVFLDSRDSNREKIETGAKEEIHRQRYFIVGDNFTLPRDDTRAHVDKTIYIELFINCIATFFNEHTRRLISREYGLIGGYGRLKFARHDSSIVHPGCTTVRDYSAFSARRADRAILDTRAS